MAGIAEHRQFFEEDAKDPSEDDAKQLLQRVKICKASGLLFYFLEIENVVQRRKGCQTVLKSVAADKLQLRPSLMEKASKALKMREGNSK